MSTCRPKVSAHEPASSRRARRKIEYILSVGNWRVGDHRHQRTITNSYREWTLQVDRKKRRHVESCQSQRVKTQSVSIISHVACAEHSKRQRELRRLLMRANWCVCMRVCVRIVVPTCTAHRGLCCVAKRWTRWKCWSTKGGVYEWKCRSPR